MHPLQRDFEGKQTTISAWFYSISLLIIADCDFVFKLCVFFSKLFWYGGSVVGRLCTLSSWSFCGMHIRMWNLHVTAVDLTIINYDHKLDGNTGWLCMSDVICEFRCQIWILSCIECESNGKFLVKTASLNPWSVNWPFKLIFEKAQLHWLLGLAYYEALAVDVIVKHTQDCQRTTKNWTLGFRQYVFIFGGVLGKFVYSCSSGQ